jgi:hypothetical protein
MKKLYLLIMVLFLSSLKSIAMDDNNDNISVVKTDKFVIICNQFDIKIWPNGKLNLDGKEININLPDKQKISMLLDANSYGEYFTAITDKNIIYIFYLDSQFQVSYYEELPFPEGQSLKKHLNLGRAGQFFYVSSGKLYTLAHKVKAMAYPFNQPNYQPNTQEFEVELQEINLAELGLVNFKSIELIKSCAVIQNHGLLLNRDGTVSGFGQNLSGCLSKLNLLENIENIGATYQGLWVKDKNNKIYYLGMIKENYTIFDPMEIKFELNNNESILAIFNLTDYEKQRQDVLINTNQRLIYCQHDDLINKGENLVINKINKIADTKNCQFSLCYDNIILNENNRSLFAVDLDNNPALIEIHGLTKFKQWSPEKHIYFPENIKQAVPALILSFRSLKNKHKIFIPKVLIFMIIKFLWQKEANIK